MKKYINKMTALLALAVATVGCDGVSYEPKMGDVNERLTEVLNTYNSALVDAPYGWIAELETSEGIYRFFMDFKEGNRVEMYTDNLYYPDFKDVADESSYRFQALQRPVLIFDTYTYISIINDPDPEISAGNDGNNQGLYTDFEFEVVSYDSDFGEFMLQGRRNKSNAKLVMATQAQMESAKAGGLMESLEVMQEYIDSPGFKYIEVNGDKVAVNFGLRSLAMEYTIDKSTIYSSSSTTSLGINGDIILSEPLLARTTMISAFKWDAVTKSYTAVGAQNYPVKTQNSAIIGLDIMLGAGSSYKYNTMIVQGNMYNGDMSCAIAKEYNGISGDLKAAFGGLPLGDMYFDFKETPDGNIIDIGVEFGLYLATFTYDIFENPNGTIRFIDYDDRNDAVGNAETLLKAHCVGDFLDYFKGKTFRKEWLQRNYMGYQLGALVDINDSSNYLPAVLL